MQNWPIRSSFFYGETCSDYYRAAAGRDPRETVLKTGAAVNVFDDEDVDQSAVAEDAIRLQKQGVHESFLMATGSADHHVYIYDVGNPGTKSVRKQCDG